MKVKAEIRELVVGRYYPRVRLANGQTVWFRRCKKRSSAIRSLRRFAIATYGCGYGNTVFGRYDELMGSINALAKRKAD